MVLKLVLSVLFCVVNGMVWYSPTLGFGKLWAANAWPGKTLDDLKNLGESSMYIIAVTSNLALMALFRMISREIRPLRLGDYLSLPVVLTMFILAARMVNVPFEPVPLVVVLIDVGFSGVNLLASSVMQYLLK